MSKIKIPLQLDLPPLYDKQIELVDAFDRDPKIKFVIGALASKVGKSWSAAHRVCRELWSPHRKLIWWVSPSYDQSEIGADYIKDFLPRKCYKITHKPTTITLLTPEGQPHSLVVFKSAMHEETLRGFKVHFLVADEMARISSDAYSAFSTTITQTRGKILFLSTPKGHNLFYDLYQKGNKSRLAPGEIDPYPEYFSMNLPAWVSPFIDKEAIESKKKELTAQMYRQEVCHLGSTLIKLENGNIQQFKNLQIGDRLPYVTSENKVDYCNVTNFLEKEPKTIVSVQTECGSVLSASEDHKVHTKQGKQTLKEAEELYYIFNSNYQKDKLCALARLVAYNMGDGTIALRKNVFTTKRGKKYFRKPYHQASFYSKYKEDLEKVTEDIVTAGIFHKKPSILVKREKPEKGHEDTYQVHLGKEASDLLVGFGCPVGRKTHQVFDVPSWIMQGSLDVKREFMAALWGAEGSTPVSGDRICHKNKSCKSLVLSMVKEQTYDGTLFFEQLQSILKDFNIKSTLIKKLKPYNKTFPKATNRVCYTIYLGSLKPNVKRFCDEIGIRHCLTKEKAVFEWSWYFSAYQHELNSRVQEHEVVKAMVAAGSGYAYVRDTRNYKSTSHVYQFVKNKPKQAGWKFPKFTEWVEKRRYKNGILAQIIKKEVLPAQPVFNITVDSPDHSYLLADGLNNYNCAEFLTDASQVFGNYKECVKGVLEEPRSGITYIAGVDLAKTHDYSVIAIFNTLTNNLVHFERFNNLSWTVQRERITNTIRKYNNALTVIDATSIGEPNVEELVKQGLIIYPFYINSNQIKRELVERLAVSIEQKTISYPPIPELMRELEDFELNQSSRGVITYSAPPGKFDDTVIATCLANFFLSNAKQQVYKTSSIRGI